MAPPAIGVACNSAAELPDAFARAKARKPDRITIAGFWVDFGKRDRCHFCDGLIRLLEIDYEVDVEMPKGRTTLHFHTLCHEQWLIEAALIKP